MLRAQTWSEAHCASSDQTDYVLLKAQKARKTSLEMALKNQRKAAAVCPGVNLPVLGVGNTYILFCLFVHSSLLFFSLYIVIFIKPVLTHFGLLSNSEILLLLCLT